MVSSNGSSSSSKRKALASKSRKKIKKSSKVDKARSTPIKSGTPQSKKKLTSPSPKLAKAVDESSKSVKLADTTNLALKRKQPKVKQVFHPTEEANEHAKYEEASLYEAKLNELTAKLVKLKASTPDELRRQSRGKVDVDMQQLLRDMDALESESSESLLKAKHYFHKQLVDIERQYEEETRRALQEFAEKRSELKESLRQEHEEMRRKCLEIAELSINYDEAYICSSNAKRKLRRRCNNPNANLNIDHLLDANSPEYSQFFKSWSFVDSPFNWLIFIYSILKLPQMLFIIVKSLKWTKSD